MTDRSDGLPVPCSDVALRDNSVLSPAPDEVSEKETGDERRKRQRKLSLTQQEYIDEIKDRLREAVEIGRLENAFTIKGRDPQKRLAAVNGFYVRVADGFDGRLAFRNILADAPRVIFYQAKGDKGRWKVCNSGQKGH